jgi:molecular chaperone GrpE
MADVPPVPHEGDEQGGTGTDAGPRGAERRPSGRAQEAARRYLGHEAGAGASREQPLPGAATGEPAGAGVPGGATPGPGRGAPGAGESQGRAAPEGDGVDEADGPGGPAGLALRQAERQRDEYLDSLRRLQAEFDNYRKRVERQQKEMVELAATGLVKKLLPVLDTADLALAHGGGEEVKQVAGALYDVLGKEGLLRVDPEGQPFDPEHHDAVAHEPAEGDGAPDVPLVVEVLRAGYEWKGRVLRPAMVKVRG